MPAKPPFWSTHAVALNVQVCAHIGAFGREAHCAASSLRAVRRLSSVSAVLIPRDPPLERAAMASFVRNEQAYRMLHLPTIRTKVPRAARRRRSRADVLLRVPGRAGTGRV
jgi:hypothetical protein